MGSNAGWSPMAGRASNNLRATIYSLAAPVSSRRHAAVASTYQSALLSGHGRLSRLLDQVSHYWRWLSAVSTAAHYSTLCRRDEWLLGSQLAGVQALALMKMTEWSTVLALIVHAPHPLVPHSSGKQCTDARCSAALAAMRVTGQAQSPAAG